MSNESKNQTSTYCMSDSDNLYVVRSGEGRRLEICEDEDSAIGARARWMDTHPDAEVEVYERVE